MEPVMANNPIPTTLAPFLSVRNAARAVDFYKSAFRAEELIRHEEPTGAIVSNLAINGYGFWVADEPPSTKTSAPRSSKAARPHDPHHRRSQRRLRPRRLAAGATVV